MSALPLSPCVQICLLDPLDQICLGCGRHIDEIAQWANLSALQRQAILNRLGDILFIEATDTVGSGGLKFTGQMGEVMNESAQIAWTYVKRKFAAERKLDQALGSSPAALLAGNNEIERVYTLTNLGNQEGLDWLEAVPRAQENAFERVRLGFNQGALEAMELRDAFGQVTIIKFAGLERNAKLPPETFRFVPPKGADVITE